MFHTVDIVADVGGENAGHIHCNQSLTPAQVLNPG